VNAKESLPFITVVIPTRNRLTQLRRALRCVEEQDYPAESYEVIVVDDGSSDGTDRYLQALSNSNAVRTIVQQHAGPGAARNAGARAGGGDIVAFTDDDCLPERGWLAALAQSFSSADRSAGLVVGGRIEERVTAGQWLQTFYATRAERQQAQCGGKVDLLDSANVACDRTAFLSVGGFSESLAFPGLEDMDLSFRLEDAGCRIRANPAAVVGHAGATSLGAMARQAFDRGRGSAMLMNEHPRRFAGSRAARMSASTRHFIRNASAGLPASIRSRACAPAAALAHVPFAAIWAARWVVRDLPARASHYRRCATPGLRIVAYLCLEWIYQLLYFAGQVAGTGEHFRKGVRG
jgi:GT2 family glycosyltransferase